MFTNWLNNLIKKHNLSTLNIQVFLFLPTHQILDLEFQSQNHLDEEKKFIKKRARSFEK